MNHKHHKGNGEVHIDREDLFVLVKDPLSKCPKYFIGHCEQNSMRTTALKHAAKKMDHQQARAWHDFLNRLGHDVFLAVHHQPEPKKSKYRIVSSRGEGPGTLRRYL
jgi:hypothetical protein